MNNSIDKAFEKYNYYILIVIVFAYLFTPGLFLTYIDHSSYASSFLVFSIFLILICFFIYYKNPDKFLNYFYTIIKYIALFLVFILIHTFFTIIFNASFDYYRTFGSIIILLIISFSAYCLFLMINTISNYDFYKIIIYVVCTLLLLGLLTIVGIVPKNYQSLYAKPIFPFPEPSHYVLFLSPFFFTIFFSQELKSNKIYILLVSLILLAFITNLTFVILVLIAISLSFGINKSLFFFACLLIISLFFLQIDFSYYLDRLNFKGENLSTLVWLQGWDEAFINFKTTYGLGLGFQQLGVNEPKGDASNAIYVIMGDFLNRYDGGTMAAKLISEFGVFGIIVTLIMFKRIIKSINYIRNLVNFNVKEIFYHSCIIGMILDLFVRSVGYIGPSSFMFILGVIGLKVMESVNYRNN